jgi:hypothetical protein
VAGFRSRFRIEDRNNDGSCKTAAGFLPPREADEQPESVDYRDSLCPDGEAAGAQASLRVLQASQLSPAHVAERFLASNQSFPRGAGFLNVPGGVRPGRGPVSTGGRVDEAVNVHQATVPRALPRGPSSPTA